MTFLRLWRKAGFSNALYLAYPGLRCGPLSSPWNWGAHTGFSSLLLTLLRGQGSPISSRWHPDAQTPGIPCLCSLQRPPPTSVSKMTLATLLLCKPQSLCFLSHCQGTQIQVTPPVLPTTLMFSTLQVPKVAPRDFWSLSTGPPLTCTVHR